MAEEFTPITTQEDLNKIIGERLTREREAASKKYADYDDIKGKNAEYAKQIEELNKKVASISEKDTTIADLQKKVKQYETDSVKTRVAFEVGLNPKMASRLVGDNEDDIRKDAQAIYEMMGNKKKAPSQSDDAGKKADKSGVEAAYRSLLDNITNKGE